MTLSAPPSSETARAAAWLVVIGSLMALSALRSEAAPAELLPLEPGMAVVTVMPKDEPFEVLVVMDLRDPECTPEAELAAHWSAPMDSNLLPNPTGLASDEWTVDNLGGAFGVALDDGDPPSIYVTTADVYSVPTPASGRVMRIDGTTGAVSVLAELPNTGVGLGNVCFDAAHRQLLVTSFEDGRIYRLALDGTLLGTFDPFGPDDGSAGWAPLGERLWGVGTWEGRAYYGRWTEDWSSGEGPPNEVHSVGLDAGGAFLTDARLEVVVPEVRVGTGAPRTAPVSDLAFDGRGSMFVAERAMSGTMYNGGIGGRVQEYEWTDGAWRLSPHRFEVGELGQQNAFGGVDVLPCVGDTTCALAEPHVVATGQDLHRIEGGRGLHGVQIMPRAGGGGPDSYIVDASDLGTHLGGAGDVEYLRHPEHPAPRPTMGGASARDLLDCGPGVEVSWEPATFTGTSSSGTYSVHRSAVSCADAVLSPPLVTGLSGTTWIDATTEPGGSYFYVVEALDGDEPACVDREASVARACVEPPVTDVAIEDRPEPVFAVLRASHEGQRVTLSWSAARALLADEHFHLLKAAGEPTAAFRTANGEGDVSRSFTATDASSRRQYFDLRVANPCEILSPDEYPAGWDVP